MKRYVFFLRHFNDIDNIAPAIFFFLQEDVDHMVDVILYYELYDYRQDPNLTYLKSAFGERFSYAWIGSLFGHDPHEHCRRVAERHTSSSSEPKVSSIARSAAANLAARWRLSASLLSAIRTFLSAIRTFVNRAPTSQDSLDSIRHVREIRRGIRDQASLSAAMQKVLNEPTQPSLVVFDLNRTHQIRGLLDAIRARGVQHIVAMPVSPLINYNTLREDKFVDVFSESFRRHHDYSGLDALGYVDRHFVDSMNHTMDLLGSPSTLTGKITTLGSIRFCPEWLTIRSRLVPPFQRPTDKIRMAFLLSAAHSNVNWDEVQRALRMLCLFPAYDVVVKGHTRHAHSDLAELESLTMVDENVDSSALIEWADVILFWSTSVAIEGYMKGKTMVCLKYVVSNRNLYAKYEAGHILHCRDDLHEFLTLYKDEATRPSLRYGHDGAERLVNEVVVPKGEGVVERYLSFMRANELQVGTSKGNKSTYQVQASRSRQ